MTRNPFTVLAPADAEAATPGRQWHEGIVSAIGVALAVLVVAAVAVLMGMA
jgi:hypothetical protein